MEPQEILNLPMGPNGIGAPTVGAYLGSLLLTLWEEDWQYGVYTALVRGGAVQGMFRKDDVEEMEFLDVVDRDAADEAICAAIRHAFGMQQQGDAHG